MNAINDLIEMGFIQEKPLRMIGLHPMMQDIVNYKTLFQTIENVVTLPERDDTAFLLLFIENAVPYMGKYRYEPRMNRSWLKQKKQKVPISLRWQVSVWQNHY